jgi:uncharacterized protein YbaR (Trm112 family)
LRFFQRSVIAKGVLDVLACPVDKAELNEKDGKLVCARCDRAYDIREGVPVLLP